MLFRTFLRDCQTHVSASCGYSLNIEFILTETPNRSPPSLIVDICAKNLKWCILLRLWNVVGSMPMQTKQINKFRYCNNWDLMLVPWHLKALTLTPIKTMGSWILSHLLSYTIPISHPQRPQHIGNKLRSKMFDFSEFEDCCSNFMLKPSSFTLGSTSSWMDLVQWTIAPPNSLIVV